jgi:hypothetical protein
VYNLTQVRALQTAASSMAEKMAKDGDLTETIVFGIDAKVDAQRSSFAIHLYLRQMFDADEIAALPIVGSKEKDAAGNANNNPDIVEYTDLNGNKKSVSFWRTVASSHPIGKMHLDAIQAITDSDKVQNQYTGKPKHDLNDLKKTHQDKFTTFFGNLRQAVALFDAIDKGNEVPGVKVELAMVAKRDDKGKPVMENGQPVMEPTPSVQCVKVSDATDPSAARYFTITNYLRLKPLNASDYASFIVSNKRQPDNNTKPGVQIAKISEFEDASIAMVAFVNSLKATKSGVANFIKHYIEKGSDDRLLTLAALADDLDIVLGAKAVKDKLDSLRLGVESKAA